MITKVSNQYADIAIVLPVYKERITFFEQISLEQGKKILSNYQFIFAVPEKLNVKCYDVREEDIVERFNDEYFASIPGYNRLLLSTEFYKRFSKYKHILIYQLDCFVFEDRLLEWCQKGYDFIGAPFVREEAGRIEVFSVGNGGLSLRNIAAHLRVLNSFSLIKPPLEFIETYEYPTSRRYYPLIPFMLMSDFIFRNNTHHYFNYTRDNEDHFWGEYVNENFDWYKVPNPEEALGFAFEVAPRALYELNQNQLPFGCHAWWKYDLDFWQPHIEKFGFSISKETTQT